MQLLTFYPWVFHHYLHWFTSTSSCTGLSLGCKHLLAWASFSEHGVQWKRWRGSSILSAIYSLMKRCQGYNGGKPWWGESLQDQSGLQAESSLPSNPRVADGDVACHQKSTLPGSHQGVTALPLINMQNSFVKLNILSWPHIQMRNSAEPNRTAHVGWIPTKNWQNQETGHTAMHKSLILVLGWWQPSQLIPTSSPHTEVVSQDSYFFRVGKTCSIHWKCTTLLSMQTSGGFWKMSFSELNQETWLFCSPQISFVLLYQEVFPSSLCIRTGFMARAAVPKLVQFLNSS